MMDEQHINKKRKMEMMSKNNKELARRIILYCPAASKLVEILAWEDQRLDLGTIARTFGIEPSTLKLNGHFISRGVDLIASSVTWRSLLRFFSSKGLSTGTDFSGALVVDGKLAKCGTKRGHEDVGLNEATLCEETDFRNTKKMKESNNGEGPPCIQRVELGFRGDLCQIKTCWPSHG